MLRTGNAVEPSLEMCTRLGDQWSRQSCHGGVFMESFSPSLDLKPPPFDPAAPLEPCPSVAEGYKLYCYLQVADNLVRGFGTTGRPWPARADGARRRVARDLLPECRRQASGSNYGKPAAVAELCAIAGDAGRALRVRRSARHGEQCRQRQAGRDVLQAPVTDARVTCFDGVGTIVATLYTDSAVVRRQCAALTREHAASCARGAGLPAQK